MEIDHVDVTANRSTPAAATTGRADRREHVR
jgi:hypothetical protein